MKSWTAQEDEILKQLYDRAPNFRKWKWITNSLAQKGINKSQYQCRQRFINKLDPSVKQQNWTSYQIKKIFKIYDEYGSEWCSIQKFLIGRTQNSIKNKFYSVLRNAVRSLTKSAVLFLYSIQLTYHDPSSAQLIDLYLGKKKFLKVRGLIQQCLQFLNYSIDKEKLLVFIQKNVRRIENFLDLIIFDKIQKPSRRQTLSYDTRQYQTKDIRQKIIKKQHQNFHQHLQNEDLYLKDMQKRQKVQNETQHKNPNQQAFQQYILPSYGSLEETNDNMKGMYQNDGSIYWEGQPSIFLVWCSAAQVNAIFQNFFS